MKFFCLIIFFLCCSAISFAQRNLNFLSDEMFFNSKNMSSDSTIDTKLSFQEKPINYTKVSLVVGTYLATLTTIHIYELNAWWKGFRKPFHFQEDLVYGRSVDKVGHFWSGNILAELLTGSLQWGNVSEEQSIYYGAIGGSVFQLFVEVEDGFSSWGFDRVDAAADILGGFYPVIQYHYPFFQHLQPHPQPMLVRYILLIYSEFLRLFPLLL